MLYLTIAHKQYRICQYLHLYERKRRIRQVVRNTYGLMDKNMIEESQNIEHKESWRDEYSRI